MTSAAAPRRIAPTIHWLKSCVTPTMASTAASGYDGAHTILSEYRASALGVADIVIPIFSPLRSSLQMFLPVTAAR
jgi:hypothetical protein